MELKESGAIRDTVMTTDAGDELHDLVTILLHVGLG